MNDRMTEQNSCCGEGVEFLDPPSMECSAAVTLPSAAPGSHDHPHFRFSTHTALPEKLVLADLFFVLTLTAVKTGARDAVDP